MGIAGSVRCARSPWERLRPLGQATALPGTAAAADSLPGGERVEPASKGAAPRPGSVHAVEAREGLER
ncbi:MAG TPA: hypothetical protein PLB26_18980, partial [Rubrivivax sp.]|nr:hypothetical protein [Rubrivivax sp.]